MELQLFVQDHTTNASFMAQCLEWRVEHLYTYWLAGLGLHVGYWFSEFNFLPYKIGH